MAPDKVRGLLDRIAMFTATEPFNSDISRFAQGLALQLSAVRTHRLGEEWDARAAAIADWSAPGGPADARLPVLLRDAGSLADVPPPAPGYHDAKAFPELDVQRIPTDLCDAAAAQEGVGMGGGADAGPSAEAGVSAASVADGCATEVPSTLTIPRVNPSIFGGRWLVLAVPVRAVSVPGGSSAGRRRQPGRGVDVGDRRG